MTQATPIIAVAAALRAHLDKTHQYSFVKSLSNVAIDSVSGITYPRTWDLEDPDTEVGFINSRRDQRHSASRFPLLGQSYLL